MTEFHFEDPDLKDSTLEIGFPSCAIAKDNFTDSQGSKFERKTKSLFCFSICFEWACQDL